MKKSTSILLSGIILLVCGVVISSLSRSIGTMVTIIGASVLFIGTIFLINKFFTLLLMGIILMTSGIYMLGISEDVFLGGTYVMTKQPYRSAGWMVIIIGMLILMWGISVLLTKKKMTS